MKTNDVVINKVKKWLKSEGRSFQLLEEKLGLSEYSMN